MIQYDKDGVTLYYLDAAGKRVSHNFMEGTPYDDMVKVRDAQLQAIRENTQAKANYNTALDNVQQSVSAGRDTTAPPKPPAKVVDDQGAVTFVPFDPPLPDLIPHPTSQPSAGSGASTTNVPVDKQAVMYNMVLAMFRKQFPEVQ